MRNPETNIRVTEHASARESIRHWAAAVDLEQITLAWRVAYEAGRQSMK